MIYNIVTAVGVILFGIAANTPASLQGAIYYLIHDMVIKGALFMLAGALFVYAGTNHLKNGWADSIPASTRLDVLHIGFITCGYSSAKWIC